MPLAPPRVASVFPWFAVLSLASLSGCAGRVAGHERRTAPPLDAASIRGSSEYQAAERAFHKADRRGALVQIDALLRRPGLTGDARTFLERQRDICLAPNAGRTAAPAPSAAPTPRPRTVADADCGPRALLAVCRETGAACPSLSELRRLAGTTPSGTSLAGMEKAAKAAGFAGARGVQMDLDALSHLSAPALAWVDGNHYVAVLSVNERREGAVVLDPNTEVGGKPGKEESVALKDLLARSGGILLTLERRPTKQ